MVVVLHAYSKSFTAIELAIVFSLYELMGVVTEFNSWDYGRRDGVFRISIIDWFGAPVNEFGHMLLAWMQMNGQKDKAMVYVTAAQKALCGIAKDLTKLGGKNGHETGHSG